MKKLVVLALILAISGVAGAGLTMSVIGPVAGAVNPGQVVQIQVNCTADQTATLGLVFTVNGAAGFNIASASNFINSNSTGETVLDWTGVFPGDAVIFADAGRAVAPPITMYSITGNSSLIISNIFVTAGAAGTSFSINLTDDAAVDYGTQTINVVPEPMTLGLLGLGGLFLRRRLA